MAETIKTPGSKEALKQGCKCCPKLNNNGFGITDNHSEFVYHEISSKCILHDDDDDIEKELILRKASDNLLEMIKNEKPKRKKKRRLNKD